MKNLEENGELTVIKHNKLIEARYSMTIAEQRIFLYMVSLLNFDIKEFSTLNIYTKDIINKFNLNNDGDSFSSMRKACESLISCKIDISNSEAIHIINVFASIYHKKGSGLIQAKFSEEIKPYLLELRSHFTKYNLTSISQFKSEYSIRIYEILKMTEFHANGQGKFFKQMTVESLRKTLGIKPQEYLKMSNLEVNVIKRAVTEISAKSDLLVEYEKIKIVTKITSIKFICQSKKLIKKDNFEITLSDNEKELQSKLIKEFETLHIRKKVYDNWFKMYDSRLIKNNFEYTMQQYGLKKVKNLTGYMNKALEYNYWNSAQLEKLARKQKEDEIYKAKQIEYDEEKTQELMQRKYKQAVEEFEQFNEVQKQQVLAILKSDYPHLYTYYLENGITGYMPNFIMLCLEKYYKTLM